MATQCFIICVFRRKLVNDLKIGTPINPSRPDPFEAPQRIVKIKILVNFYFTRTF